METEIDHEGIAAQLIEGEVDLDQLGFDSAINLQWELIATALQLVREGKLDSYRAALGRQVSTLNEYPIFPDFQLWSALKAISAHLSGLPVSFEEPHLQPSGFAPLDSGNRWRWAALPLQPYHGALGLAWLLLGRLTGRPHYTDAAVQVARWQLNLLDTGLTQPWGLFRQGNTRARELTSLLFYGAGILSNESQLLAIGERLLMERQSDPVENALLAWISGQKERSDQVAFSPLSETVCDPQTALVGYRSPTMASWATLSGGGTGLGSLRFQDAMLVNYGPAYAESGPMHGFGVESSSPEGLVLKTEERRFLLQGRTHLTPKETNQAAPALFRHDPPSTTWLDIRQEFSTQSLAIDCRFHSLQPLNEIEFRFYLAGEACQLSDGTRFTRGAAGEYEGRVQSIDLLGKQAKLHLSPLSGRGIMRLHVLENRTPWGADYCITTLLDPTCIDYHWRVVPQN